MIRTPYRFLGDNPENDQGNILKIYCRLKPIAKNESCYIVQGTTKLCAIPPQSSNNNKQMQFLFKHVFSQESTQKEVFDEVAFPLVQKVLQGQNSLLFSYGNTGSGKTYTMKGTLKEGGIMPRCLDVIFNSISQKLAKKHIFKSDKFNGYEIQSEKDASSDSHRALLKQIGITKANKAKLIKKHNSDPDLAGRFIDPTQILMINDKNSYAVFITFIEIYNNSAYDLLDDTLEDLHTKHPSAKPIREDSKKNMFVHGVTEVEVTSTEEAYEIFYKGLKKRRVAQTLLNAQSSRSHSVFTIKVVQANLSGFGKIGGSKPGANIPITVGQLSLVDLAGSERSNRTQNTGKNLMEAGNINNSLMTLRQCFDAIKENQRGGSRMVPYRDSKITTLFKNFFEGDGHISMIICINPHKDDYDETLHVLKFAESTQEIHITVSIGKQLEMDEEHRRQRMQNRIQTLDDKISSLINDHREKIYSRMQEVQQTLYSCNRIPDTNDIAQIKSNNMLVSAGIEYIDHELNSSAISPESCQTLFSDLLKSIRSGTISGYECEDLKISLRKEKEQKSSLESEHNLLKRKFEEANNNVKKLKRELMEKEKTVLKAKAEKDREKEKMQLKKNVYKEKYNYEVEKLKRQRTELEMEIISKGEKLARVQRVLSDEIISTSSTPSVASCRAKFEQFATPSSIASTPKVTHSAMRPTARRANVAVSNRRHRRSRSTGDVWVEHTPAMPVPLNTVLQPSLPKRRSITKLTDAKQVTQGASKYCLVTQTQDSDGDLETRLYKGDVIPTSGGGAQVLFNDVEVLKQVSPDASPKRPRDEFNDPQPTCSYGIEGHRPRTRFMK